MALGRLLVTIAVVAVVVCDYQHEFETENKEKEAVAAEKASKARSANPDRGSIHKLNKLMNLTDHRRQKSRDRSKNISKLHQLNMKHRQGQLDDMMNDKNDNNDNEGGYAINQKTIADNDTNSLKDKMNMLRPKGSDYQAVEKYNFLPQVSGVFCSFENMSDDDLCQWDWNSTRSSHGLGFNVMTAADVVLLNTTTRGLKFSGPITDADGSVSGHFLYLPVDPTMENMVIKSPVFRGLWEFCKFEAWLHQSRMANASIKLVSESAVSGFQWVLQEIAGNNFEGWHPMRFTISKVQQEVHIMLEITRPNYVSLSHPLPHIAIDNIRMLECVPEPPVFNGQCQNGHLKCKIMDKDSCIKLQQVCDLVKDCDDASDENQNCDKMPYGSYCNFEHDACGFENVPQPILKWSRHSGPTPTDKTGPNYDHTCGPPDPYPTMLIPPLFPAHMNYSMSNCVGYYFFVNMNVTGPNQAKPDFASTAVMKTVVFNPPPRVHGNMSSRYYNCCVIRFYYQQNGRNYGSLSVDLITLTNRGNISTSLWFSTKDKGENWYRASIFLPNVTSRYYLEFKTRMGMRIYSDSAIDDFSMAPECFGLNIDPAELGDYNYYNPVFTESTKPHPAFADKPYYHFTTCGAVGRFGPNQTLCDAAYNNTPVSVTVVPSPPYQGIQVWEVPEEGLFTIIAMGASGGLGSAWAGVSHGAQVRALFKLYKGERVYMLIGQEGENACKKLDKESQAFPLLVAGGGGGISVGIFRDDGSQHGKPHTNATPESGWMYGEPGRTSGAGGGWTPRLGPVTPGFELVRGASVKEGGGGGRACSGGAHGGFGGGGGGCLRGGGGGGWLGGNTNEGEGNHGGGGWSFVDFTRAEINFTEVTIAARSGPGEVFIIPVTHACGCDYRCVALNEYRSVVQCYCPPTWSKNSPDGHKCILESSWPEISWVLVIVLSVAVFVFALAVILVCLYLYNIYQRRKEAEMRQKRLIEQEVQLHRLRNAPGNNDNLTMAFNPHYGSESILPQGIDVRGLPQVARDSLKLVKALGQGAFGEVYQGLYKHRQGDTAEMPVAVKTLPELSTGQAESDFLMEAAIMAKFNHPNIVHLIGVCFDRHPRFIVLELLAGGDLKNFLRESRPKPERASALTMKDLLLCSIDVCKGCRYLEAKRFIHRDIAARNCLLTSRGPGRVVKIADFGMARDIYRAEYYKKGGKAMLPIKWMPPEAYIDGVFTIKTDVWSFGVLLWEVFSLGVMPYTGCANREVMEMVSGGGRLEKPYGCPQEIYRLMSECWNPTPDERPAFAHMFDRLSRFLQDPEIVGAPLPVVRSLMPQQPDSQISANGPQRGPACDYLVPMSPQDLPPNTSSTDSLVPHSDTPTAAPEAAGEDSPYPPLLKASQEYGNIPMGCVGGARAGGDTCSAPATIHTRFQPSNSTDRLIEGASSMDEDEASDDKPAVWETTFTEPPLNVPPPAAPPADGTESEPAIDKLISITPTSPMPPDNALTLAMGAKIKPPTAPHNPRTTLAPDSNHRPTLALERKIAPIASPDPPRINKWDQEPIPGPKPKPLTLDAGSLEENLKHLKDNRGTVNLRQLTRCLPPPYVNVVDPNELDAKKDAKVIEIDPKKAVIDDLMSPDEVSTETRKLKQSNSNASLLNGPMTDVPYADSDATSSSGGSQNAPKVNHAGANGSSIVKQGTKRNKSEISC